MSQNANIQHTHNIELQDRVVKVTVCNLKIPVCSIEASHTSNPNRNHILIGDIVFFIRTTIEDVILILHLVEPLNFENSKF